MFRPNPPLPIIVHYSMTIDAEMSKNMKITYSNMDSPKIWVKLKMSKIQYYIIFNG